VFLKQSTSRLFFFASRLMYKHLSQKKYYSIIKILVNNTLLQAISSNWSFYYILFYV